MKQIKLGHLLIWGYGLVLLPLNLVGHFLGVSVLEQVTKPLLMPVLVLYVVVNQSYKQHQFRVLVFALLFSWIGDMALLFDRVNENLFLVGLMGFLIAHIHYIILFKTTAQLRWIRNNRTLWMAVMLVYGVGLVYLLSPNLGSLFVPVVVYAFVLISMAVVALVRCVNKGKNLVLLGAILFVISDSILAVNKFILPLDYGRELTMLTYGTAQLFIVIGILPTFGKRQSPTC